jgi:hypothetical protein
MKLRLGGASIRTANVGTSSRPIASEFIRAGDRKGFQGKTLTPADRNCFVILRDAGRIIRSSQVGHATRYCVPLWCSNRHTGSVPDENFVILEGSAGHKPRPRLRGLLDGRHAEEPLELAAEL